MDFFVYNALVRFLCRFYLFYALSIQMAISILTYVCATYIQEMVMKKLTTTSTYTNCSSNALQFDHL